MHKNRGQAISSRYPLDALTLALKVVVEHPLPLRFLYLFRHAIHIFPDKFPQVISGQFTRSGQVTLPPKKFMMVQ